jgi:hypothetical protein
MTNQIFDKKEIMEMLETPQPVEFKRGSYDLEKNIIFYYSVCGTYAAYIMFRGIDPISAQFEWKYGIENIHTGASIDFDQCNYRVDEKRLSHMVENSKYLKQTAEEYEKELALLEEIENGDGLPF